MSFLTNLLCGFQWYRKLKGGRWEMWIMDRGGYIGCQWFQWDSDRMGRPHQTCRGTPTIEIFRERHS